MITVTVDYDDLEALLFATGAIKDVENAIKGRDRDPLVRSTASRLTAAHDRVAAAWRRAKREPPPEPSTAEVEELRRMFTGPDGTRLSEVVVKEPPVKFAQRLLLVEYGPAWYGTKIDWPAPSTPEFRAAPYDPRDLIFGVRLTTLGEKVLAEAPVVYPLSTETGEVKAH
jgi:hypothetical protein